MPSVAKATIPETKHGGDRRSQLMKFRKEQLYLLVCFMRDSQKMTFKEISEECRIAKHPISAQRVHQLYQEAHEYFQTDPELHEQLTQEQQ